MSDEAVRGVRFAHLVLALVAVLLASAAGAHEVRPGYLELRQREPQQWDVLWKVPARGDRRLRLEAVLPPTCEPGRVDRRLEGGAWIDRFGVTCPDGLAGGRIVIDGLPATRTDVLVRIEWSDGSVATARLVPDAPSFQVTGPAGTVAVARAYLGLGVEHILLGIDHLLFVLALLFLVTDGRRLVATITAFTVAHSVTLTAATLGWVHVPQAPVEATIALSIVFVAAEVARGGAAAGDLARRRPWLVAFAFGLLHGLGFAGALRDLGLPESAIPLALLSFNVGVEVGQLVFVAVVFTLLAAAPRGLRALRARCGNDPWRVAAFVSRPVAYAIGPLAALWLFERTAGFWS